MAYNSTDLANRKEDAEIIERVLLVGDLAKLSPADRVMYYTSVCRSIGLNPLTRPFDYLTLNGRLTLYANRGATDQARSLHNVSLTIMSRELIDGEIYVVTARATDDKGRSDESTGAVCVKGLIGDARANAMMKAETKAKRRVTLSLIGLGWMDETEVITVPGAQAVQVDGVTGEIIRPLAVPKPEPKATPKPRAAKPAETAPLSDETPTTPTRGAGEPEVLTRYGQLAVEIEKAAPAEIGVALNHVMEAYQKKEITGEERAKLIAAGQARRPGTL